MKEKSEAKLRGQRALAALAVCMTAGQGAPALAQREVDLRTLELLREESISEKEFYASFTERKLNARRAVIGGNSYSRSSISGASYSRSSISNSSYSRSSISNSSYSRSSITNASYSRSSITRGSYSRSSITGQRFSELEAEGPIPGPIVSFEADSI